MRGGCGGKPGLSLCDDDLMAETATSRMDRGADFTVLFDAHLTGRVLIVDFFHGLNLGVMISSANCSQLRQAALLGPHADLARIGRQHPSVLLTVLLVLGPNVLLPQQIIHAHLQRFLQVVRIHWNDSL